MPGFMTVKDFPRSIADRVTIVAVTYNSAGVVDRCLTSIPDGPRVIVVDNASADGTADRLEAHDRKPEVIRMTDNAGFGAAANTGLKRVATDFGLLLNVDLTLGAGVIDGLIAAADRYPDAGLLSPEIREPNGRLQFGRHPHLGRLFPARGWSEIEPEGDCCAAYAGGAAMFIRMVAMRDVGGFDENLFLFGDDDDLCLRLTEAGWSLIHVAGIHARHESGGSTTGVDRLLYWKQWHMAWSRLYLEAKHNGLEAAKVMAGEQTRRYRRKAFRYRLFGRRDKVERNLGRADGAGAFLEGVEARDARLGQNSE